MFRWGEGRRVAHSWAWRGKGSLGTLDGGTIITFSTLRDVEEIKWMDLLAFQITFVAEEQLSVKMGLRPFCLSLVWLDCVPEVDKGLCLYLFLKTMQCFKELERSMTFKLKQRSFSIMQCLSQRTHHANSALKRKRALNCWFFLSLSSKTFSLIWLLRGIKPQPCQTVLSAPLDSNCFSLHWM